MWLTPHVGYPHPKTMQYKKSISIEPTLIVYLLPLIEYKLQNHLLGGPTTISKAVPCRWRQDGTKTVALPFVFTTTEECGVFFSFFFFYFDVIFFATPSEEMMSCEGNSVLGPLKRNEKTSRMSSSSFRPTAVERLKRRVTEHFFAPTQALSAFFPFDGFLMFLFREDCASFSRSWIIQHVVSFLFTFRIISIFFSFFFLFFVLCIPDVVDGSKTDDYNGRKVS